MTYKICYWDSETKSQHERDATPAECAEFDALKAAAEIIPIPQSISMRAARLTLLNHNLLTATQNFIANYEGVDGEVARINWEYSLTVDRQDPLVKHLTVLLGKTDEDIDQLFIEAGKLN